MIDLKMTEDGELVVGTDGDLQLAYGDEQLAQEILFKLKTTLGDWRLSPNVGSNLERFIGQPNEPLTHSLIKSEVYRAITRNNFISLPTVDVIPVGENEVLIIIEFGSVEEDGRVIQIQSGMDLRKGLVFSRITG